MTQTPIAMEQLRQLLQLHNDGVGIREMARRIGISRNSVRKYLCLLSDDSTQQQHPDNKALAEKAYTNDNTVHDMHRLEQLVVHLKYAQGELGKVGVTRQLLWREYLQQHPDGYAYSHYCHHLNQYLKKLDVTMHMEYSIADMIMIDFAGKKLHYIDLATGELIEWEVFIAILPFSGLIFCEAVHSQQTADFVHCINAMLLFYGGAPNTILCDNLRTAVKQPNRYEPLFTDICTQLSEHYATTFSATRPYSPRDKAMVEKAVNIIYNNVYGPLRKREFTNLKALNAAVHEQLLLLNNKPYKSTPYSRWHYFEQQEQSSLKPLPPQPFSAKKVVQLTVQRNYHVQLSEDHRYYSVPYVHVGKKVKVLYDQRTVEVYLDHQRIALHRRDGHNKAYTTLAEHMPPHHQRMQLIKGWNREDLLQQAARIGTSTHQAAGLMLENSIYIEQNYKACFGMLMLQKKYGSDRLEAACNRALTGTRVNYTLIKNILERGMDKSAPASEASSIPLHDNIRGKDHYQ
ncbi:IS21 family transposase [Chitinophaga pinensis]|uniref:Integrase catalytic region n=1 Tax=Chitinophaga pinensis (strain ATCC 43595 / DSM 2588 / LMG 13176 / NBRC 15968 / NCIMB 11800 / UQM 2034) TaxID=485918 RepID=A0A979GPR4_CHIPD|nr:IS21 family transposase [Chitinophaga pinensis]ACU57544.1 Integrase catalytic region [Chitinophaga pinensis DSM 2588]